MKTAVFGGSGFLGSHLADALSEQGHEVVIFDLKPSPYVKPAQKMIIGDILDQAAVREALNGCDYVYHFAGLADLDDASTKPLDTVRHNVMGTAILLEASVQAKVQRFVYASTIYVYSNLGGFYRCSKQSCELYIEEYQRRYGLDYTILRFGTIYGPRADHRNSIWRYLKQALLEGKIIFPGTGEEIRAYAHVRDAAQLSADILDDEFKNRHVTITGHHPIKTKEMLAAIKEISGNKISIEYTGPADNAHYLSTPYSFVPKLGKKLVTNHYVDMGQGLLECFHEMYPLAVDQRPKSAPKRS
ncbi:MAG: NAD(P)-dependent oxidoreductase [Elusimicrobia bacterium]|nr:NAD(P)-dependent oxidoreductase [Elusimicrobiota bacterium]